MASFTKKAIRDSFVKLLNEKPLSQITIRDIMRMRSGLSGGILPSIPWTIVSMQHWNLLWPIGKRCFISIIPSTETFMSNTNGGSVLMWSGRM